jgi:hypothetical protein
VPGSCAGVDRDRRSDRDVGRSMIGLPDRHDSRRRHRRLAAARR